MGHLRLKDLPRSRKWREVVELLGHGAGAEQLATATIDAADRGFSIASDDPGLVESIYLLAQLPIAARSDEFVRALRDAGLDISSEPTQMEIVGALSDAIDARLESRHGRTDLGEMASVSANETLVSYLANQSGTLFGTPASDLQDALARLATNANFSSFARSFYARITERYLGYFLSRAYAHHVGDGERFSTLAEQASFEGALRTHCREASLIVERFAGEWFSKTRFEKGEITRRDVSGFAHIAMQKIFAELKVGAGAGAG